jgi:membrane-associated protease RseP (regulator of RpoE activity)
MEERYLFPVSASEPASSVESVPLVPDSPAYRQTIVYRLPQTVSAAITARPARQGGLTFGRVLFHLLLVGLTAITMGLAGLLLFRSLTSGAVYAVSLLMILSAHEMGHYIACRWYGVEATPPYFIPFFIPLPVIQAGTFGAFIKIKSPIPSRRALFDIGIAGPLAGFAFLIPVAFIGHYYAQPAVLGPGGITLQDPLLFKFFIRLLRLPTDLELNPLTFAAWIGALMTSLNLLPVGQLDGGHVTYATLGARGHRAVSIGCYLLVVALAVYGVMHNMWNWVVWLILLSLMMRAGHPPVMDETEPLGPGRILVALIGLLVFVLCFMPFPISL